MKRIRMHYPQAWLLAGLVLGATGCHSSASRDGDTDVSTDDTADTADTTDTVDTADTADSDTADTTDTVDTDDTADTADTDSFDTDIPMDTDNQAGLDWVFLEGDTFQMGGGIALPDAHPAHTVTVPDFEMTRTEITNAQYRVCMEAGVCSAPITDPDNYFDLTGYENHPVTHVEWQQARLFCLFAMGRLPSESEWEFAARSRGLDILYPWGNDLPTEELVVTYPQTEYPIPVCSRPDGNTAQELCDMSGNVQEYVQDTWHNTYDCDQGPGCDNGDTGAHPDDGSAWETAAIGKVVRGDPIDENADWDLTNRIRYAFGLSYSITGFRCAR